jgi:hypothetical protein
VGLFRVAAVNHSGGVRYCPIRNAGSDERQHANERQAPPTCKPSFHVPSLGADISEKSIARENVPDLLDNKQDDSYGFPKNTD